jgi:hypothetical protein
MCDSQIGMSASGKRLILPQNCQEGRRNRLLNGSSLGDRPMISQFLCLACLFGTGVSPEAIPILHVETDCLASASTALSIFPRRHGWTRLGPWRRDGLTTIGPQVSSLSATMRLGSITAGTDRSSEMESDHVTHIKVLYGPSIVA